MVYILRNRTTSRTKVPAIIIIKIKRIITIIIKRYVFRQIDSDKSMSNFMKIGSYDNYNIKHWQINGS